MAHLTYTCGSGDNGDRELLREILERARRVHTDLVVLTGDDHIGHVASTVATELGLIAVSSDDPLEEPPATTLAVYRSNDAVTKHLVILSLLRDIPTVAYINGYRIANTDLRRFLLKGRERPPQPA